MLRTLRGDGLLVLENQKWRTTREEAIDVLKRPACCFGVEEIDWRESVSDIPSTRENLTSRNESTIENSPNNVEGPMKVLNAGWSDLDDHEVKDPVRRCTKGSAFGSRSKRVDLGRIKLEQ